MLKLRDESILTNITSVAEGLKILRLRNQNILTNVTQQTNINVQAGSENRE